MTNYQYVIIKSIIDPRLADHVRREALKFVDELKRAVRLLRRGNFLTAS